VFPASPVVEPGHAIEIRSSLQQVAYRTEGEVGADSERTILVMKALKVSIGAEPGSSHVVARALKAEPL
jgi:hypothetical protein